MGKTSMLNRIACDDLRPNHPLVRLTGQNVVDTGSPYAFVRAIARQLNRIEAFDALCPASDKNDEAKLLRGFSDLGNFAVLLDEANLIALPERGFNDGFLNHCRALCQGKQICWISAARENLHGAFAQTGRSSLFLNDSREVWMGQLEERGAREMLRVLGRNAADHILRHAGRFPLGLQRMGDDCWRRTSDCTDEKIADGFVNDMSTFFDTWWTHRTDKEKQLLTQVIRQVPTNEFAEEDRRMLRKLATMGLVTDRDGVFGLPGEAWKEYVKHAG